MLTTDRQAAGASDPAERANPRPGAWWLLAWWGGAAAMLAAVGLLALHPDLTLLNLLRDPATVGQMHPFTGLLSNLGVVAWSVAFGVCLVGYLQTRGDPGEARFLAATGLFTAWLLFDDLFMLHDHLVPTHLGLPQESVYAVHLVAAAVYFGCFCRRIFGGIGWLLVVFAVGCFAASLSIDFFGLIADRQVHFMVEDGFKFLGIAAWAAWIIRRGQFGPRAARRAGVASPAS